MVIFKSRVCVVHTVRLDFDFRGAALAENSRTHCLIITTTHYNNSKWWVDDILTLLFVAPGMMGHHIRGCLKAELSGHEEIIL